jgi:hypothetical protein
MPGHHGEEGAGWGRAGSRTHRDCHRAVTATFLSAIAPKGLEGSTLEEARRPAHILGRSGTLHLGSRCCLSKSESWNESPSLPSVLSAPVAGWWFPSR